MSTQPRNLEELERIIREVMRFIPQEFLVKSVDTVRDRLEKLVANDGAHIEFLKKSMQYPFFSYLLIKDITLQK